MITRRDFISSAAAASLLPSFGKSPTPYDYEVEYLESTGTQNIITDIVSEDDVGVLMHVVYAPKGPFATAMLFGSWGANNRYGLGMNQTDNFAWWNSAITYFGAGSLDNSFVSLNFLNSRSYTFTGESRPLSSKFNSNNTRIALFNALRGDNGEMTFSGLSAKVGEVQISKGDSVIRKLIPVVYKGEPCMYDEITKQFFMNNGTGHFIAGPRKGGNIHIAAMGEAKFSARSYVQDGLISMWDGIENAGWGVHNESAVVWKDLCGNVDLTFGGGSTWESNHAILNNKVRTVIPSDKEELFIGALTVEQAFILPNTNRRQIISIDDNSGVNYAFASIYYYSDLLCFYRQFAGTAYWNESATPISVNAFQTFSFARENLGIAEIYREGVFKTTKPAGGTQSHPSPYGVVLGGGHFANASGAKVYCTRVYNRKLSASEIATNYAIDKARFNLP